MDLLARVFGGGLQASYAPDHDFWYAPVGTGSMTPAGIRMDKDQAQKIAAWFRGRWLLATGCAMLPLPAYKRLDDGGRERVDITVGDVVGRKPNVWQNAYDWRKQRIYHLIDFGNSYDLIVPGTRGFLDQLWPIHPSLVTPRQIKSTRRVLYDVRDIDTGQITTHSQDDIFHMRINADDSGVVGKGILDHARDSLGLTLSLENYAGTTFGRGAMHSGLIKVPGLLDDDASERMARSFVTNYGNWHLPKVLEQGAEWIPGSFTPEQAQMVLSRQHGVDDIARWLGVPRLMLENNDPSHGNAAQFQQNFLTFSLGDWLKLMESAINDQLVIQTGTYYVEFKREAWVQADIEKRWQAHQMAVQIGAVTRNEVRVIENFNKLPGLDEPLDPAHLTGKQAASDDDTDEPRPAKKTAAPKASLSRPLKAESIALKSVKRLLQKEINAVRAMAVQNAADEDAFAAAVADFYAKRVRTVAEALDMTESQAQAYCSQQAAQVLQGWITACETWMSEHYAAGLLTIALGEAA